MRIVILTPIPFWHPGTAELIKRLQENGLKVIAIDIWSLKSINENGVIRKCIPGKGKGLINRVFCRLFRTRFIKRNIYKEDIIDIHWCDFNYYNYIDTIKNLSGSLIATIYGSDIYRNTSFQKEKQKRIFNLADRIVLGINMQNDFENMFPGHSIKMRFNQYGSARLDLINDLQKTENIMKLRNNLGLDGDKIVVSVGYNAKQEQQHLLFFREVSKLDELIKNKLHFLVLLTYGEEENPGYSEKIIEKLKGLNVGYTAISNWISDTEIARLRLVSDITVNIQTTDALSSSVKEALAAGDVVLVGDWLPYDIYEEMGAFFFKSPMNSIITKFSEIIENLSEYKKKCIVNKSIILEFSSWNSVIPEFINTYKELSDERN